MAPKSSSSRDDSYLLDILIASKKAIAFIEGLAYQDFLNSELHQNAVIRPLEIIGEAARKISEETKSFYPQIPWVQMIGMRNRLIHDYLDVDLLTVWDTIQEDLPPRISIHVSPLSNPWFLLKKKVNNLAPLFLLCSSRVCIPGRCGGMCAR